MNYLSKIAIHKSKIQCARGENRTRKGLLPRDFKSLVSTSFTTRAIENPWVEMAGIEPASGKPRTDTATGLAYLDFQPSCDK